MSADNNELQRYYLVDLLEPGMGNLMVVPGSHKRRAITHNPADDPDPVGAVEVSKRLCLCSVCVCVFPRSE
jgi:hypothetical protein